MTRMTPGIKMRAKFAQDMEIREGNFRHTFRLFNGEANSFGDTYLENNVAYVNLVPHSTFGQLMDSIIHEDVHVALKRELENLNIDLEHELIKRVLWAMEGWILNGD